MPVSRRRGRARFTIVLFVLTSVVLLTIDGRGSGPLSSVRSAAMSVLSPVGDLASTIFSPVRNAWSGAFTQDDLAKENERLQEENDRLKGELTTSVVSKEQLQQLLQLVGIPFVGDTPVVHTRVVSGTVGNFGETVELDKGSSSGIEKNMPVITGEGLIGKVVQVSDNRSVVALITGGSFNVNFNVVGTPAIGTAQGTGSATILRGGSIDVRQSISPGQIVVTSGLLGSPFPPNLPIGTITALRTDEAARETSVDITMFANTRDLTYADVVLWKPVG
ncbi:MreC Cell shape-determining protein [Acidimicrobiia bacterium]